MNTHLELENGNFIHTSMVKRLRHITEAERASLDGLSERVDGQQFSTRIDYRDGSRSYSKLTIDEIADNGIALVQVERTAFVPRDNIQKTRAISVKDRASYEARLGRPMRDDFKSQIETKAGKVLSTETAKQIMQSISYPYQPQTARPQENALHQQRESVMQAASEPSHAGPAKALDHQRTM